MQPPSPAKRSASKGSFKEQKPAPPQKKMSTDDLIQEQLRSTLKKKIIKLADLFAQVRIRASYPNPSPNPNPNPNPNLNPNPTLSDLCAQWDVDGDGEVSLKEWRAAMPAIGIQADKRHIDRRFEQLDLDPNPHPHPHPHPSPNPSPPNPNLTLALRP